MLVLIVGGNIVLVVVLHVGRYGIDVNHIQPLVHAQQIAQKAKDKQSIVLEKKIVKTLIVLKHVMCRVIDQKISNNFGFGLIVKNISIN